MFYNLSKEKYKKLPIFENLCLQNLSLKYLRNKNNLEEDCFSNDLWPFHIKKDLNKITINMKKIQIKEEKINLIHDLINNYFSSKDILNLKLKNLID